MPPMSPPPPTATSTCRAGLLLQLERQRALPQQRLGLVVGVHRSAPESRVHASLAASASA